METNTLFVNSSPNYLHYYNANNSIQIVFTNSKRNLHYFFYECPNLKKVDNWNEAYKTLNAFVASDVLGRVRIFLTRLTLVTKTYVKSQLNWLHGHLKRK